MAQSTGLAFSLFGPSKPLTPKEKIEQLKQQQIDNPMDPEINYNLGVAYYKGGLFNDAHTNFTRALEHIGTHEILEKQCLFNAGSSSFQQAMSVLPHDWENQEMLDQELLQRSITNVKESINHYKKFVDKEHQSQKGAANLKYVEKILKKLEEKLQKQQQQQKQDKQQKDQQKQQNQQQKDQQQQSDQKKQQEQQNQQQQDGSEQKDKDQQQSSTNEQKEHDKKEGAQKNDGDNRKDATGESQERPTNGENDKLKNEKNEQKEQNVSNHRTPQEQQSEQKPSIDETKQGGVENQEKEPEGMEVRGLRALLENLQSSEADAQKRLLLRKVAETNEQPQQGQKPW